MKTLNLLHLAGVGDALSLISRMPNIQKAYSDFKIKVWCGGFGKSPQFCKEAFEREGYEATIIKNLVFHNQLAGIEQFIKEKMMKDGDEFMNVSFCQEIFLNQKPPFIKYPMNSYHSYVTNCENENRKKHLQDKKAVAIHCLTKSGNAEGFEADKAQNRFWTRENWIEICKMLSADGFTPLFVGIGDEDWGVMEELNKEGISFINTLGTPVDETIEILKSCVGGIFCNSWDWTVTSHLHLPTVVFYTKNHFFLQNHVPQEKSDFHNTCYVETSHESDAQDIYSKWKYMYDNKKKPEVPFSVAMCTMNDEGFVERTLKNISPYIKGSMKEQNDVVIVDGGSKDKTKELISKYIILDGNWEFIEKEWEADFSIQKNFALEQCKHDWRILIDSDETFEHLLWNQMEWYLWEAEQKNIDCIFLPRINIIDDMDQKSFESYVNAQGWQVSGFNWINYPDWQARITNKKCYYQGKTHEQIVGYDKKVMLIGCHIMHRKTKARQDEGLQREHKQYVQKAEEVYEKIMKGEK